MEATLYYSFMDESGTVGVGNGTHFLVIAILATPNARSIELTIRRTLKKFHTSLTSDEIKAADFDESAILRLLSEIAKEEITIVASIVDQQAIRYPPKDMEEVYRRAAAWTVRHLA